MHIQYNVISADTLRDAQKNPDQYRELFKHLRDDIIVIPSMPDE